MAENIRVLIEEEKVDKRIEELGKKISEEYAGKEVHLICILKGSIFFTCELAKRITVPVTIDFMQQLWRRHQVQRSSEAGERPG